MPAHIYRIFDLTLASTRWLPELPEALGGPPEIHFRLAEPDEPQPADIDWCHRWTDQDGEITVAIGTCGHGYALEFPRSALFVISPDRGDIRCHPASACPDTLWRHLLLDHVIPQVLAHRGELVAHAGAALIRGACACFLGESGAGKSTLVAALSRHGHVALADDGVILRPEGAAVICIPSYLGARLWPDSLTHLEPNRDGSQIDNGSKQRIVPGPLNAPMPTAPLAALFFLAPPSQGEEILIEPVAGPEAMIGMIQHSFLMDVTDRRHLADQFAALGRVLATGPGLFRIAYPRDYGRLSDVCGAITETLTSLKR